MMTPVSTETVVAIVFGIIMTVVGILAWLDGRRRSSERGTTLPQLQVGAQSLIDG